MRNKTGKELLKAVREFPELPIIPFVDCEVVADDFGTWMGRWGDVEITQYYAGREYVHLKSEDEEDVLNDLVGCQYGHDPEGRDIYDLSDEEWDALYNGLPWVDVIAVYITT